MAGVALGDIQSHLAFGSACGGCGGLIGLTGVGTGGG